MTRVCAKFSLLILLGVIMCTPYIVWGQETPGYVRLIGIPYYGIDAGQSVEQYLNALYRIAITIAAMLAVLRLILAGAKYILTDIVPAKQDAKGEIRGALVGLLIVLSAVFVLQIINDNLVRFNFLDGLNEGINVSLQPRPSYSTTIGDQRDRSEVDLDIFRAECEAQQGEFTVSIDTVSCTQRTRVTDDEYLTLLNNTNLSQTQKEVLRDTYGNLENIANLTTADFEEILNNRDANAISNDHAELFGVINERYDEASFDAIKQTFIAAGDTEAEAITNAFEQIVRDEAVFIQQAGTGQRREDRQNVCTQINKSIYRINTNAGEHLICI